MVKYPKIPKGQMTSIAMEKGQGMREQNKRIKLLTSIVEKMSILVVYSAFIALTRSSGAIQFKVPFRVDFKACKRHTIKQVHPRLCLHILRLESSISQSTSVLPVRYIVEDYTYASITREKKKKKNISDRSCCGPLYFRVNLRCQII